MRRGARERGRTVLLSSHILAEVEALVRPRDDHPRRARRSRPARWPTCATSPGRRSVAETERPPAGLDALAGVHDLHVEGDRARFDVDTEPPRRGAAPADAVRRAQPDEPRRRRSRSCSCATTATTTARRRTAPLATRRRRGDAARRDLRARPVRGPPRPESDRRLRRRARPRRRSRRRSSLKGLYPTARRPREASRRR